MLNPSSQPEVKPGAVSAFLNPLFLTLCHFFSSPLKAKGLLYLSCNTGGGAILRLPDLDQDFNSKQWKHRASGTTLAVLKWHPLRAGIKDSPLSQRLFLQRNKIPCAFNFSFSPSSSEMTLMY